MLSGQARADGKGIPYNDQFVSASFPYARTVAGCTDWRRPAGMSDEWSGVSFAGACQQHDRCYHSVKMAWGECNQQFQENLRLACDRDLEAARLASGKFGKPDGQALQLCYEITNLYMGKVQTSDAAKRFEFSQKQQLSYMEYVKKVIDRVFVELMKRPATDREIERTITALEGEYSLEDLKTALMGSKTDESSMGNYTNTSGESESSTER
jgi:hypothetical protein